MKIQRFEGKDAQEALQEAQRALGPDAVILQTRRVQASGIAGLLAKSRVEVVAAIDPAPGAGRGTPNAAAGSARPPLPSAAAPDVGGVSEIMLLKKELAEIRSQLAAVAPSPRAGSPAQHPALRAPHPEAGAPPSADAPPSIAQIRRSLRDRLTVRTIEMRPGSCTAVALIGPTGVGKTTTAAKLAAVATHVEGRRVALITLDTYRIGAVDQLKTYARLLEIPLAVVRSVDGARSARAQVADRDLVLIDTIGRSPRNVTGLAELAAMLEAVRPDETHLVLDASSSYAAQRSFLRGFQPLRPTHLLLTKLDQAPGLRDALGASLESGLPLSYVSAGQEVPDDLAAADGEQLEAWLAGTL